jgi:hypothetical protein
VIVGRYCQLGEPRGRPLYYGYKQPFPPPEHFLDIPHGRLLMGLHTQQATGPVYPVRDLIANLDGWGMATDAPCRTQRNDDPAITRYGHAIRLRLALEQLAYALQLAGPDYTSRVIGGPPIRNQLQKPGAPMLRRRTFLRKLHS